VVIAGSDKTTRRRAVRRQRDPSFLPFGTDLRQAREDLGLSLEAVQDRTGIRRSHLEALEESDLSPFSDEKAALVAVRRYSEVVGLDSTVMVQIVSDRLRNVTPSPTPALVGSAPGGARALHAPAPAPAPSGHLSRFPGDTSHLRAFTQTAQVPMVGPRPVAPTLPPGLRFDSTDAVPVTWRGPEDPPPAPLALRVAVWSTVLLLVLALAGLAVHHWKPAWLAKIHLVATTGTATGGHRSSGSPSAPAVKAPLVTETSSGPLSASIGIRSPVFEVVVVTTAPCWIHVSNPTSFAPLFSATVPAGTTKTFTSGNGQLSVELGASHVTVTVQILDKTVPGWSLTPSSAPFVANFHATTS
jgi:cytoskeleton protein RodZ